jgi:hypothetical protein
MLPASRVEQQAAAKVKDTAQPMVEDLTDTAKEIADNLKEPAQQAMWTDIDFVDTVYAASS